MENQKNIAKKKFPTLVYDESDVVIAWVEERIPEVRGIGFENAKGIGVLSTSGNLICGVVYDQWKPEFKTMQLTIAADHPQWARKEIIRDLLSYPFIQLNIFKSWVAIPSDNEKSLKTVTHIGFTYDGTLQHQYGEGRHAIIGRMLKPDFERMYGVGHES